MLDRSRGNPASCVRFKRFASSLLSLSSHRLTDFAADIWSFGITAIELSLGRAPNSYYPPAKVLSKTILDDPPTLDREGGAHKYSKAMKEMIECCLHKDPSKRCAASSSL